MPIVKRQIEPVFVCRRQLDTRVKNELEGVAVNSLGGVIRQLSSLAKHADDVFGELLTDATALHKRFATLEQRVEEVYKAWDPKKSSDDDDHSLKAEDIVALNHFKSSRQEQQDMLSRNTLSIALQDVYLKCDGPPPLSEFTKHRDDQKDALMTFYTDPGYFYRLWVEEQSQLLEKKKRKDGHKRHKRDYKPKKTIIAAQKRVFTGKDVEFRDQVWRPSTRSTAPPHSPQPPANQPCAARQELSEAACHDAQLSPAGDIPAAFPGLSAPP